MKTLLPSQTKAKTVRHRFSRQSPAMRQPGSRLELRLASADDREEIYRIRHEVYACEIGQHPENPEQLLRDALDETNEYLVARRKGEVLGFVSITPPGNGLYSIDKYFEREELSIPLTDKLYEIRLLTVLDSHRNRELSLLLMYAAYRWVEAHGGTDVVGIGRREVVGLYQRLGLQVQGPSIQAGAVTYDLMHAGIDRLAERVEDYAEVLRRIESRTDWCLSFPFRKPAACFHGGAFFDAVGDSFENLERRHSIINADVLDAWFPPAPSVLETVVENLPWLLRTSPPTACQGLVRTIAESRQVNEENILPGAGSSDLIFRALRHWLDETSRVLILDPSYGEYAHVLEEVIGCHVDRFSLSREEQFQVDLERLEFELGAGYDLVVLVNPNSPTGQHVAREQLEACLQRIESQTRVWVDETYVDYLGSDQSLEHFAASSENVIVCKSMSKMYALSGARVAYLCAGAHLLESLRAITPPWVVSLPAQVSAVKALQAEDYYRSRWKETAMLRQGLADQLRAIGWEVLPSVANFLLCELPPDGPDSDQVIGFCRKQGLFLRDPGSMGSSLHGQLIRIAVKDAQTNQRMVEIIRECFTNQPDVDFKNIP